MGLAFPKTRKRLQTKRQADRARDKAENVKVVTRSGGRCEVREVVFRGYLPLRCPFWATQVHHMIGGHGKRARGISGLAEHKQHVCDRCHLDITGDIGGKKLKRIGGVVPLWTDPYERM